MNCSQLQERLITMGVDSASYALNGGMLNGRLTLKQEAHGPWAVYYCENGQKLGYQVFDAEAAACQFFLGAMEQTLHNIKRRTSTGPLEAALGDVTVPLNALVCVFAFLFPKDVTMQAGLLHDVEVSFSPTLRTQLQNTLSVIPADLNARIPFLRKAIPALAKLPRKRYNDFQRIFNDLVQLDGVINFEEFILLRWVDVKIRPNYEPPASLYFESEAEYRVGVQLILSLVADYADNADQSYQQALDGLGLKDLPRVPLTTLDLGLVDTTLKKWRNQEERADLLNICAQMAEETKPSIKFILLQEIVADTLAQR